MIKNLNFQQLCSKKAILQAEVENLRHSLEQADAELTAIKMRLLAICEHTQTEKKKDYYPADVYESSITITCDECITCGKKLNFKREYGL